MWMRRAGGERLERLLCLGGDKGGDKGVLGRRQRRRGTCRPAALLGVAVPAAGPKPRREAGALQLQAAADPPQVGDDVDLAGFGVGVPTHRPPQVGRLLVVPGSLRESKLMVFVEQLQYFL